jgi:hypothetical protein
MQDRFSTAIAVLFAISLSGKIVQAQQKPNHPSQPDTSAHPDSMASMPMSEPAMMSGPLGIPETRTGSGTSWLPDAAPMHAIHFVAGSWSLMAHGVAFGMYDKQFSRRGDDQVGSVNWGMLMASRSLGRGSLQLRGMFSAEPLTVGTKGYPLLLQSGESYKGEPLHDRQHPHDLFMELAGLYERPVSRNLAFSIYVAPVGEPAVGPVAFPHRPSAANDPLAPLAHHWQDATHISFGVLTVGLFTRTVKVEGSWFNGREPDEKRYNFDYKGRSLDSYAGRLTVNPSPNWSLSGSYAFLKSPEELRSAESQRRLTAAVLYSRPVGHVGNWSSAIIYGGNKHTGRDWTSSLTAESNLDINDRNAVFGRLNYARKSGEDLAVVGALPSTEFDVGSVELGFVREVASLGRTTIGAGASGIVGLVPAGLAAAYGTRTPTGLTMYLRIRPKVMRMEHERMDHPTMPTDSMPGMHMPADSMPGKHMPADSMPAKHMPTDSMPSKHMPTDSMPNMHMPTDSMPGMHMPADSMPGMQMPADSMPGNHMLMRSERRVGLTRAASRRIQ